MSEPIAVITDIGREKTIDAETQGLSIFLDRVAVGTALWPVAPDSSSKNMLSANPEFFAIADTTKLTGNRLHLTALISGESEYAFYEFGLFAKKTAPGITTDETFLFAIAASTNKDIPLGVKRKGSSILLAFDLTLVGFKPESIVVVSDGPRLSLSLAEEFSAIATSFMAQQMLIKDLTDEVAVLRARVEQLEERR